VKENEKTTETKTATEAPAAGPTRIQLAMPIVYRTGKKKGRRRYTRGLKSIQQLGRGLVRGSERLSDGLDRGLSNFRSRTNASSKKKKDGMIIDSVKNFTKGAGKTLRTASRAPNDVVKRVNTKLITRQVRNAMRIGWPLFG
jgi:hypothetical protein